jgi:glycosyltransferase involved in cell wall biosynthesis
MTISRSKKRILVHSNFSKLKTGFGKNAGNILRLLAESGEFEIAEAANGVGFGADHHMPWKFYGTYPTDKRVLAEIQNDHIKQRLAAYGHYKIDDIIEDFQPDIYLGIEDIWAFGGFDKRFWWDKLSPVIWTTLDSVPITDEAKHFADKASKFLVWATFAEDELKKLGHNNVQTLHGGVDLSHFKPLLPEEVKSRRESFGLDDKFVIGFVFKNQLRKSVPNLLDGFKRFQDRNPSTKAKLLLHTDWPFSSGSTWDIQSLIRDFKVDPDDVLASYLCTSCNNFSVQPYSGENVPCPCCGKSDTLKTKDNGFGLSEDQLNVVYNLMDVYCHPFTSGGQEMPIQEAKAAGKITLVTDYSCGLDMCERKHGGLSLPWSPYFEPESRFKKASTNPEGICARLEQFLVMTPSHKDELINIGRAYVESEYSLPVIGDKLKDIIRDLPIKSESIARPPSETPKQRDLQSYLGPEKNSDRIAVVLPRSAGDVLLLNSLIEDLQNLYPKKKIYVITEESMFSMIDDNPFVHKLIPYHESLDSAAFLEGRADHKGFFDIAYQPHALTQKFESYKHSGKDKSKI